MTHPFKVGLIDEKSQSIAKGNPLPVKTSGIVSTHNSYFEPMGADQEFVGTIEPANEFGNLEIQTYSDQASATDGLFVEWSIDGLHYDFTDTTTLATTTALNWVVDVKAENFRVTFINGSTAQSDFRLQTILKS